MGRKSLLRVLWVVLMVFVALAPGVAPQSRAEAASLMDDKFDDNSLDGSRWSVVTEPPGTATVIEWLRRIQIGLPQAAGHASLRSVCSLAGDFGVQADFRLLSWPATNARSAGITLVDIPWGVDAFHPRVFRLSQAASAPGPETYTMPGGPFVPTTDMTGTLRFTRAGSTASGYYHDGTQFVLIDSVQTTADPTRIALHVQGTHPDRKAVTAAFDNFRVNAGSVQCPSSTLMDDNFNDTSLDASRWVTSVRDGGTVRQALFLLMTNPAGPSYAGVQSTCAVGGDFDVRVDYRLLFWPAHQSHTLRLAATDVPQGNLGQSGVLRASYLSEVYQFRSQISDPVTNPPPQVETSDRSGTLRLVRTGTTLAGYHGSGAAFTLLGTAPTTTAPTRFGLDLSFPDDAPPSAVSSRVAIAFDNFQVPGGTVQCPSA